MAVSSELCYCHCCEARLLMDISFFKDVNVLSLVTAPKNSSVTASSPSRESPADQNQSSEEGLNPESGPAKDATPESSSKEDSQNLTDSKETCLVDNAQKVELLHFQFVCLCSTFSISC